MKKLILILSSLVFLSSCALLEQQKVETIRIEKPTNNDISLASFPAQLRAVYYNGRVSCAEPVPDVAVAVEASLNLPNDKGIKSNTKITKLDGRDPTVLVTRELLFRICEMGMNYPDKQKFEDTKELYKNVLAVVTALATGKKAEEQAKAANAEANNAKEQAKASVAKVKTANAEAKRANAQATYFSTIERVLLNSKLTSEDKNVLRGKIENIQGFDIEQLKSSP